MSKIPYRPEVDGLRAVSIIGVILFHFMPNLLPGGFMGVDVFFVISGYLITRIIVASQNSTDTWLKSFWQRRLQRIFPALAVMVIAVLALVCILGIPSLTAHTGKQAVAVSAFVSNYRMLTVAGNYWGASADYTMLLHTWSLAVEEQFYFVYPVLLATAFYFSKQKIARNILLGTFLVSLFWCLYQTSVSQASAFYLLPSRAWELLAGALIGFWGHLAYPSIGDKTAAGLANLGLILILTAFFFLPGKTMFPGVVALVPVLGACLYIQFSSSLGFSSRCLSSRPALWVGKASYSLYLWHWPMLVIGIILAKLFEVESLRTIGLIFGLGLGFASYKWIEPIGKSPRFFKLYAPLAAALLVVMAASAAFIDIHLYSQKYKVDWRGANFDALVNRDTPLMQRAFSGLNSGNIRWPHLRNGETKLPCVVLLGDSHALSLASQLNELVQKNDKTLAVCAVGGWSLAPVAQVAQHVDPAKKSFYEKRIEFIEKVQPKLIVINARWENVKGQDALNAVRTLIEKLHDVSPGSKVVIVGQPPVINYAENSGIYAHEWLNLRNRLQLHGTTFPALIQPSLHEAHNFLEKVSSESKFATFIPVNNLFPIINGRAQAIKNGNLLYYDGDHLSDAGAKIVVEKLAPIIEEILKNE